MSGLFLKILNLSITASWLILAIIIIRQLMRKVPKWIVCALWALAAFRLICPFSFESALSLIPSSETVPYDIAMKAEPAIDSGLSSVNNIINPLIADSFTPDPAASANPLQIVIPLISLVWIIGMIVMLLYAFVSYFRLIKTVQISVSVKDNILACDEVKSPFILGIIKPVIYVPSFMSGETLDCVINHEKAHIQRHDHWWKPLGFLLLSVYWFNPLCWAAYILLCRDIEMACDEKVVRDMDNYQKAAYSQALLDCNFPRRKIAACPLAFGEVGVKRRVKSVLNYKKPAFWIIVLGIIVCVVVSICFLTDPADTSQTRGNIDGINMNSTLEDTPDSANISSVMGNLDEANTNSTLEETPNSDNTSQINGNLNAPNENSTTEDPSSLKTAEILYGEELLDYLAALPNDAGKLSEMGCFVISNNGNVYGINNLSEFMTKYNAKNPAALTIVQYTTEGDPIFAYASFDGKQVTLTRDSRRDKFGAEQTSVETYRYFSVFEWTGEDGNTYEEIVAHDDPELTSEKMIELLASSQFVEGQKKQFAWIGSFAKNTASGLGTTNMGNEEKWGVTLAVENVTPSGATLKCIQSGGEITGELNTGSRFIIEKWSQEMGWQEAPCFCEPYWTMEAWLIIKDGTSEWEVDWERLYGELPAGKYRIGKEIMDFRGTGDYDKQMYYAEFTIE